MKIEIIDLNTGNIGSIKNMLKYLNYSSSVIQRPEDSHHPDWIVLPGVGAFDYGMQRLKDTGFAEFFSKNNKNSKVLGICLGMQLLCEGSDEGQMSGLGLLKGRFRKFPEYVISGLRVPHMGWSKVRFIESRNLMNLPDDPRFYFVHSYYHDGLDPSQIWATSEYGFSFASAISDGNIFGVQFHPEKSHRYGMSFFKSLLGSIR
ncbi:MAG: imidazole glycerol phosphate synthase subunit HisH [Opitutales bacterium]